METGADRAWIEGRNPFKLAKPAAWWLAAVHAYDSELVVIPSVKECTYRLTRRVQTHNQHGLGPLATLHGHPDTIQAATYGLIPVTTLLTWAVRSDPARTIRDLMARDTYRHRRGEDTNTLVSDLEYREQKAKEKQQARMLSELDARSGEAFRSMQRQNGSRIQLGQKTRQHERHAQGVQKVTSRPYTRSEVDRFLGIDHRPIDRPTDKSVISRPSAGAPSPAPLVTLS